MVLRARVWVRVRGSRIKVRVRAKVIGLGVRVGPKVKN